MGRMQTFADLRCTTGLWRRMGAKRLPLCLPLNKILISQDFFSLAGIGANAEAVTRTCGAPLIRPHFPDKLCRLIDSCRKGIKSIFTSGAISFRH
jgi:hypothetical protein